MSKILEQANKPGISQIASVNPDFAKIDISQFIPSIDGRGKIYSSKAEKPSAKKQGFDEESDSSADAGAQSAADQIMLAQAETNATDAAPAGASSDAAGAVVAQADVAAGLAGLGAAAGTAAMSGGMMALAGVAIAAAAGGGGGGGATMASAPPALPTAAVAAAGSLAAGTYNLSDTSANLAAAGAIGNGAANITATNAATVAQATTIEAFTNTGTNTYNIADSAANLAASSNAVLALAGTVTSSDAATAAEANTIAAFAKAVVYSISDTAAAIAAATAGARDEAVDITATGGANSAEAAILLGAANMGSTTIDAVTATAAEAVAFTYNATGNDTITALTISGTANVAQATAIMADVTAGDVGSASYSLSDTAANLAAAGAIGNSAVNITATTAATVAEAATIEAATNSGTNTYDIGDSAANLAASSNAVLALAGTVTSSDAATAAEADTIAAFAKAVVYSISDTAAAIAAATAGARNEAVDITATTAATVVEAATIEAATNSGANTYDIADSAANLAASSNAVLTLAGTVTSSDAATAAEADTIAAFAKAVVYSISDTAAAIAAATAGARDEAVDITATGGANAAEAATLLGAANMGATTIDAVTATAAEAVAFTYNATGNDTITALTISGTANVAQATAIMADVTAGDVGSASYSLSDTAAAIVAAAATPSVMDAASVLSTSGTPGDGISVADVAILTGLLNFDVVNSSYDISDTAANIVAVAASPEVTGAVNVAATGGAALNVADAATLTGLPNFDVPHSSYDISDTAANIVAAALDVSITDAAHVVSTSGTPGDGISVADVTILTGLAHFDAVNSHYDISDTAANIVVAAASAGVAGAANIAATGGVLSVADAATLTGLAHFDALHSSYDISDTATAIVTAAASAGVTGATNVVATGGALTAAGAATLHGLTNTLTGLPSFDVVNSSYDISDTAANIVAAALDTSITDAFNVVSTSGTPGDGISVADVAILTGLLNFDVVNSSYDISDTAANIVAAAASPGVTGAVNVAATGGAALNVTDAATLTGLPNFDVPHSSYDISDTAANIVAAAADASVMDATNVVATGGVLSVADAATLTGLPSFDALNSHYDISDTAANIVAAAADASITDAFNVVSTIGAGISVAGAAILTGLLNFDPVNSSYDIIDTAANIVLAAADASIIDASNVLSTSSASGTPGAGISVTDVAILTALVNLDPASSYDISDTAANIVLAAASLDVTNAASVVATDGLLNVADAITLTALLNFDAPDSRYDISDTAANFAGALPADVTLVAGEAGMVSLSDSNPAILSDTTIGSLHFVSGSTGDDTIDSITSHTTAGRDYITCGDGADTINVSAGGDRIDLGETVQSVDTVVVAAGTSTSAAGQTAEIFHFDPSFDVLDLPASTIAGNTAGVNGTDVGVIKSHAISSGMISFGGVDTFASALHVDMSNFDNVAGYLETNIANGDTVAFYVDRNNNGSYTDAVDVLDVFQGNAGGDIMIAIHDTAGAVTALGGISAVDTIKIV